MEVLSILDVMAYLIIFLCLIKYFIDIKIVEAKSLYLKKIKEIKANCEFFKLPECITLTKVFNPLDKDAILLDISEFMDEAILANREYYLSIYRKLRENRRLLTCLLHKMNSITTEDYKSRYFLSRGQRGIELELSKSVKNVTVTQHVVIHCIIKCRMADTGKEYIVKEQKEDLDVVVDSLFSNSEIKIA